uniref:B-cell receptor CD22-like isoform X2 n=1 Tax=Doryrhamphus excisus TaxID=161450 RepID=UPI0025AE2498|nr:B-cell receptor CD22-like isoform X2 [Doryrhamphus excisus]
MVLGADWGGKCTPTEICAEAGTTVNLHCYFTYPATQNERETKVEKRVWFIKGQNNDPEDLMLDPDYFGRLQSDCHDDNCSLTIADLRQNAVVKFRFTTNHPSKGAFTIKTGVRVSVIAFEVQVPTEVQWNYRKDLKCLSTCSPWPDSSYIWYKNGKEIPNANSQDYSVALSSEDSYSCAKGGHEHAASPPECVSTSPCRKVVYEKRRICALKGSRVDIICKYGGTYSYSHKKFWFRPDRSHMWKTPSIPEDITLEPQYKSRLSYVGGVLTIKNVKMNDSAQYCFKFQDNSFEWKSILPGSILTVTDVKVRVMEAKVEPSYILAQMLCYTHCRPEQPISFEWQRNGVKSVVHVGSKLEVYLYPGDYVTCTANDVESPPLYALHHPLVNLSNAAEILEGRPLILTCNTDVSASTKYCWYRKKRHSDDDEVLGEDPQLVYNSIKSSDSAEYWCTVENELGKKTSEAVRINVQYAPRSSSLFVNPSHVIKEGQLVILTCSSDANPAASYIWYKDNRILPQKSQKHYLRSIRPEDAGTFSCQSENKYGLVNSSSVFIDVQYAPKVCMISVGPSSEVRKGASVSMNCSSDANPEANYKWFKTNDDLNVASESSITFTNIQTSASGEYHCVASNGRGRCNATVLLQVETGPMTVAAYGSLVAVVVLVVLALAVFLVLRKKRPSNRETADSKAQSDRGPDCGNTSNKEQEDLVYSKVSFTKSPDGAIYSNVTPAPRKRFVEEVDCVEYAMVKSDGRVSGLKPEEGADVRELYSTVQKHHN